MVSVPPMCTQAYYWNMWKLPPQYVTFDEAHPYPSKCPTEIVGLDAAEDLQLYDEAPHAASPIIQAATAAAHGPKGKH